MWRADHIADILLDALAAREQSLRAEHAVYGLDALSEVDLHPLLTTGLAASGLGALREQPYPHEWRAKRQRGVKGDELPERRDRWRCDLVVTPEPNQVLCDPLAVDRAVARHRSEVEGSLFESTAAEVEPEVVRAASAGVPPEEAYWLEVKLISQHCYTHGVPGPNRTYASELRRAATDLAKLNEDERIHHSGLLIVLFTESEGIALHDLTVLTHACLDLDLPIASPQIRSLSILERIGNATLTIALIDLRKLTG